MVSSREREKAEKEKGKQRSGSRSKKEAKEVDGRMKGKKKTRSFDRVFSAKPSIRHDATELATLCTLRPKESWLVSKKEAVGRR